MSYVESLNELSWQSKLFLNVYFDCAHVLCYKATYNCMPSGSAKKETTTSCSAHQTLNTFLNMSEPRPFVHGKMLPISR